MGTAKRVVASRSHPPMCSTPRLAAEGSQRSRRRTRQGALEAHPYTSDEPPSEPNHCTDGPPTRITSYIALFRCHSVVARGLRPVEHSTPTPAYAEDAGHVKILRQHRLQTLCFSESPLLRLGHVWKRPGRPGVPNRRALPTPQCHGSPAVAPRRVQARGGRSDAGAREARRGGASARAKPEAQTRRRRCSPRARPLGRLTSAGPRPSATSSFKLQIWARRRATCRGARGQGRPSVRRGGRCWAGIAAAVGGRRG